MIKKPTLTALVLTVLFSLTSSAIASSDCATLKGCEKKFCGIKKELEIAQEHKSTAKEDGLKISLKNAKEHCTDKGLKEELTKEIDELEEEIKEYESDLKEAREEGKKDKIHKYQEKIKEEQYKIKKLENELSDFN